MNPNPDPSNPAVPLEPEAGQDRCRHAAELTDLRHRLRHVLAGAVGEQLLTIEQAAHILDALDLPALPYRWTVRLRLAFVCEVTATSPEVAFDVAEDLIETATRNADAGVDINWDRGSRDEATRDEIDLHALDAEQAGSAGHDLTGIKR